MSDLVDQLRREGDGALNKHLSLGMWELCAKAAVRIERLEAALRTIADVDRHPDIGTWGAAKADGKCAWLAKEALKEVP